MERLNLTNLKAARRKKGLSTAQAAEVIGKKKSAIWRYESGKACPTVSNLLKLLDAYSVSVLDIFDAGSIGGE